MNKLKISLIDPQTWIITQGEGRGATHSYLIEGTEQAILVDTGLIIQDYQTVVKGLTTKKVAVVNTHGHVDHIANNHQFDDVYIHSKDRDLLREHASPEFRRLFLTPQIEKHADLLAPNQMKETWLEQQSHLPENAQYHMLSEGMDLDLGDRQLEVIEIPGHTQGCICLHEKSRNYFFVGDMLCEAGVLLQFDHSASVRTYKESMEKLKSFGNAASLYYSGHQKVPLDSEWLDDYVECAKQIIQNKDKPEAENPFRYKKASLVYDPAKI